MQQLEKRKEPTWSHMTEVRMGAERKAEVAMTEAAAARGTVMVGAVAAAGQMALAGQVGEEVEEVEAVGAVVEVGRAMVAAEEVVTVKE